VLPIDREIARAAAQLRATHPPLRLPVAMCLAAALQKDAVLLSFDEQLSRLDEHIR
jgi:predicted exporter